MPGRRRRPSAKDREWNRRIDIAINDLLELTKAREAIACHVCGRRSEETKLWFFLTTGEDDAISQGKPTVIVACDEHDPRL